MSTRQQLRRTACNLRPPRAVTPDIVSQKKIGIGIGTAHHPPKGALDKTRACAIMGSLVRPIDHSKESLVTLESSAEFGPVERKILWEQVAEQLMAMLRERHLRPGDKLPPERELAAMMQVSRPSLREALRALSMMNVLEVRQGAGTFVTSLETELLRRASGFCPFPRRVLAARAFRGAQDRGDRALSAWPPNGSRKKNWPSWRPGWRDPRKRCTTPSISCKRMSSCTRPSPKPRGIRS